MKLYVDMGDTAVGQLIIWQEYERRECEVFHNIVRKGMTVVDAGANIGLYTIIASKLVGPTGRVFAFEPEPHNFRLLTTNLRLNTCSNVTAINAGLSDSDGSVDLFLDAENFGLHSFSQRNVSNPAGSIRVRTTTLDSSLGDTKIEILKMDVQGWEASVLRGAKHFLDRRGAAILMELWPFGLITHGENPPKLLDMLIDRGFSPTILETYPAQERTNGSDLLYEFTKRQSEDSYLNILFVKE